MLPGVAEAEQNTAPGALLKRKPKLQLSRQQNME
jgi:hypothetical protein